jgi:hypothetical protein
MPRYFFKLRGGDIETDDEDGLALPDDEAARDKAVAYARDLLAAAVLEGRLALHERIEVEDQTGRAVASVTFGQSVGLPD